MAPALSGGDAKLAGSLHFWKPGSFSPQLCGAISASNIIWLDLIQWHPLGIYSPWILVMGHHPHKENGWEYNILYLLWFNDGDIFFQH